MFVNLFRKAARLSQGLSIKLIFSILLVIIPVLSIYSYLNYNDHKTQLLNNVINEAHGFSDTIKQSTKYDMQNFDRPGVHHTINAVGNQEGVKWIRIFDKDGKVMYSSDRSEIATMVDKKAEACYGCHAAEKPLEKLPSRDTSRIFHSKELGHRILGIVNPIYNETSCYTAECHAHPPEQKVLGVIDVALSLEKVDQQIWKNRRNMIYFALISILGISGIVMLFIYKFVSMPVKRLVSECQKVSGGDLDHSILIYTKDEMGFLAQAFSQMTDNLKKADSELKRWGHTLEEKIEEKTAELRLMQKNLIQAERLAAIGQTVAGIAHYIKSLLSGLEGGIYVATDAMKENDTAEVKEGLNMLQRNVERIANLVYDLLSYSKEREPEYKLIPPNEIVRDVIALLEPNAREYNIRLTADLDPSIKEVPLDPKGIHNSILNILSNAIDACIYDTGNKSYEVKITTRIINNMLNIKVSDNGSGIDPKIKEKLFTSFFSTKGGRGTGLGLLTTNKIIQEHKGEILVETEKGKGSDFIIKLPVEINTV